MPLFRIHAIGVIRCRDFFWPRVMFNTKLSFMLAEDIMFLVAPVCVRPFMLKVTGSRSKILVIFSTQSTHVRCDLLASFNSNSTFTWDISFLFPFYLSILSPFYLQANSNWRIFSHQLYHWIWFGCIVKLAQNGPLVCKYQETVNFWFTHYKWWQSSLRNLWYSIVGSWLAPYSLNGMDQRCPISWGKRWGPYCLLWESSFLLNSRCRWGPRAAGNSNKCSMPFKTPLQDLL